VRAGGGLTNTYLGQAVGLTGLLAIGDAVATTNPIGGRGVSLGIASAVTMARILENSPRECWAAGLDTWCEDNLRRWVTDQIEIDAATLRRWAGEPFDPIAELPIDLVHAALSSDAEHAPALMPYNMLAATSRSFDHLRAQAREIVAAGWRPVEDPNGPTHASLLRLVRSSAHYSTRRT
jgi:flavin-dependent dehydrogenase